MTYSSKTPLVSVLLPIYNGADYLREAVQSILGQTYKNFELIIINDGSKDKSASIIKKIKDSRIKFYEQKNKGLAATLNRAIKISKGKYLARHDQDDISLPKRFEKQVAFLEKHRNCGMVGTWAKIIEGKKNTRRRFRHPPDNLTLKFNMLFDNYFVHSSVMIKKGVIDKIGLYSVDKSRQPPEDYELWCRITRKYEVANIPEFLHIYREIPNSMSRINTNPFLDKVIKLNKENLAWITGKSKQDSYINDLVVFVHRDFQKFSSKFNYSKISLILNEAADKLSDLDNKPRDILRKKAENLLQSAYNRYLIYKYGSKLGSMIVLVNKIWRFNK